MDEPTIRQRALALYQPPFHFIHGYIYDSKNKMFSDDDGQDTVQRVRGWGRISYLPDAAKLQNEVGALIAEALTEFWTKAQELKDQPSGEQP